MNIIIIGAIIIGLILGLFYLMMRRSPKTNRISKMNEASRESELFVGQLDDPSEALTSDVKFIHVEDLIKRDFPVEKHTEVVDALSKYTKGYKSTTYLIILQEAKGNIDRVREYVKIADEVGDYRDLALALISIKSK